MNWQHWSTPVWAFGLWHEPAEKKFTL